MLGISGFFSGIITCSKPFITHLLTVNEPPSMFLLERGQASGGLTPPRAGSWVTEVCMKIGCPIMPFTG